MPVAIQVFILVASIISLGLIISLALRDLQIFLYVTLPLALIGILIRIGKDILGILGQIPRSNLITIFLIISGIFIAIRLLTKTNMIGKRLIQRVISIGIAFLLLWFLFNKGAIDTIKDRLDTIFEPKQPPTHTGDNNTGNTQPPIPIIGLPCTLPRGTTIPDKYYIYAYQNRTDSPSICDVEIRVCIDGELLGDYEQPYCYQLNDENAQPIPFNPMGNNKPNPLIQPGPAPYADALFTIHGKRINQKMDPIHIPTHTPNQQTTGAYRSTTGQDNHCITPRGEIIHDGEFAKAYSASSTKNGSCLPELRRCNKGKLLGENLYPSCDEQDTD